MNVTTRLTELGNEFVKGYKTGIKFTGIYAVDNDDSNICSGSILSISESSGNIIFKCNFTSKNKIRSFYLERFEISAIYKGINFVFATGTILNRVYFPIGPNTVGYNFDCIFDKGLLDDYSLSISATDDSSTDSITEKYNYINEKITEYDQSVLGVRK